MIVKDRKALIVPCEKVSLFEGYNIIRELEEELKKSKMPGVGLAANQIGKKKVFVLYEQRIK